MSPKKKSAIWITALALGALATVAASSAGPSGHCRGGRGWHGAVPGVAHLERRIDRMDLPADVRTKAFAIVDASRGDERTMREKTRAAHQKLHALLETGTPNTRQLDAQVDELGALRTQQHKQYLHTLVQVGSLLPEDQRAQWFALPKRAERPHERAH